MYVEVDSKDDRIRIDYDIQLGQIHLYEYTYYTLWI